MFVQLHALAIHSPLLMTLVADGSNLRITITPTGCDDAAPEAVKQQLTVTASPSDLDEGFASCLTRYCSAKLTLLEQVDAAAATLRSEAKVIADKSALSASRSNTAEKATTSTTKGAEPEATTSGNSVQGADFDLFQGS